MNQKKENRLRNMSLEDARLQIGSDVYKAAFLYEHLEGFGKIRGNGHHIMQELCAHAGELMEKYWEKEND